MQWPNAERQSVTDSVSRNFLNSWAVLPHSTCDHCIISFTVIVDFVHSQGEPLLEPSFKKSDFDGIFLNFPSEIDLILFNCNYILFTKLPWPGDSEGTFWSSSQAATCLPHRRRLHTLPLIVEGQAGKL